MLIVEDGTGTNPYADSYVSLDDARVFADKYGYPIPTDDEEANTVLRKGALDVDSNMLAGSKLVSDQPLSIPRTGVYCNGVEYQIPQQLKSAARAQVIYASNRFAGVDVRGNDDGKQVQSEKVVGAVEVSYFNTYSTTDSVVVTEAVDALGCMVQSDGVTSFKVCRG